MSVTPDFERRPPRVALLRLFSLRDHGVNLLDIKAAIWQARVTALALFVAMFESVVWTALALIITTGQPVSPLRIGFAVFCGLLGGCVALVIEVSLATLDLFAVRERADIEKQRLTDGGARWKVIVKRITLPLVLAKPFAVRVALIVAVSIGTIPALEQVFFSGDIENKHAEATSATFKAQRDSLEVAVGVSVDSIAAVRERAQQELENETSGTGRSRRYGCGPTCRAIEQRISGYNTEIAGLTQRRDSLVRVIEGRERTAVAEAPTLVERYRWAREVADDPANAILVGLIHAVLFLLYGSLITLKLTQPNEAEWYYSGTLQSLFIRYLKGELDRYLDPAQRASLRAGKMMTVGEFHSWYVQEYRPKRALETQLTSLNNLAAQTGKVQEAFQSEKDSVEEMVDADKLALDALETNLRAARSHKASLTSSIIRQKERIEDARRAARLAVEDYQDAESMFAVRTQARTEIPNLESRLAEMEGELETLSTTIENLEQEFEVCSGRLSLNLGVLARLAELVADERRAALVVIQAEGVGGEEAAVHRPKLVS